MTTKIWLRPVKETIWTVVLSMASLFAPSAHAAPVLSYAAWDSSQTGLFFQGLATSSMSCWSGCAGNVAWVGNNLSLEFRQAYGSAAWASTKSNDTFNKNQDLPSPAKAVGIAFEVTTSFDPTAWVVQLDLGTYADGMGASYTVSNMSSFYNGTHVVSGDAGGGIPLGNSLFDPLRWTYFDPFSYSYRNGVWSVEMFYPDQWILDRSELAQRFSFFSTDTFGGPSQLVDGITHIDNVRWILSDTFPTPPSGTAPEPATIALVVVAVAGIAVSRKRTTTPRCRLWRLSRSHV